MTTRTMLAMLAIAGCSSQYVPRSRGRIAPTIQDGKIVYLRDGRSYENGVLGGGLVDAVAGNPSAMQAANEYHDRMWTGLVASIVGLAVTAGGSTWAVAEAKAENNNVTTPLLVAIGGLVLVLAGGMYAISAEPYRWDAINMFNDGVEARQTLAPGWNAARASVPRQTLRMGD